MPLCSSMFLCISTVRLAVSSSVLPSNVMFLVLFFSFKKLPSHTLLLTAEFILKIVCSEERGHG